MYLFVFTLTKINECQLLHFESNLISFESAYT